MARTVESRETPGFGLLLRALRRRAGLTQEALAGRSGLSDRAIRDLERGRVSRPRRATIDLLVRALGLDPGDADRLRMAAWAERRAEPGPGSVIPPPSQLPADIADFVGRGDTARRVVRLLRQAGHAPSVPIVALAGIGGVGKTTLAVHIAHAVREHFTDGQLYVDLRGVDAAPMEPAEVLAGFLRALGVAEAALPKAEQERAALYRTLMADRRTLVVLDNARDSAQVRALLPGSPACAVLTTSRSRPVGLEGATLFDVGVLTPEEGRTLLAEVIGAPRAAAEPAAAERLLETCGRLPLAVRIAGARLAARPGWSLRTLADRLACEQRTLDELQLGDLAVRASFQVSYALLAEGDGAGGLGPAQAFRLLGSLDGVDIGLDAAAAALGGASERIEPILESLVDARLLETPAPGRYRFHDLIRLFAVEKAEGEEDERARHAALGRLVDHYLDTVEHVDRLVRPGRLIPYLDLPDAPGVAVSDYREALDWLDREHANLLAIAAQAATDGGLDAFRVALLAAHVGAFLEFRGLWDTQARLAGQVLELARKAGDRHAEALAGHELALVALHRYQTAEADRWLVMCLEVYRAAGDAAGEARALNNRGILEMDRDVDIAGAYFTEALEVCRRHGIRRGECGILSNLGVAHQAKQRFSDAAACYEQALAIHREVGNPDGAANTINNLGRLYMERARYDEAIACHWESLRICRKSGNRYWESDSLVDLAAAYRGLGLGDIALLRSEQALTLCRELGHAYGEAKALTERGHAMRDLGRASAAVVSWEQALAIFERLGAREAEVVRAVLQRPGRARRRGEHVADGARPPIRVVAPRA
ncbi:MAG: tetratricopeptide repeat protein [Streptosporangiales bacterium]|nr:tetratricopeptide repeat protein [Streptosporangiales bacterium]